MSLRNKTEKRDAFAVDLEELGSETYGGIKPNSDLDDARRMVGKPTDIMTVYADRQQPRRAIPPLISIHWDGSPDKVIDLFLHWQAVAEQKVGKTIPVIEILNGQSEGFEADTNHAHFVEFLALLQLAQSIHREGLINPITVIRRGDNHVIESGERRWLAHHLLNHFVDPKYGKVPAIESKGGESVWRQARENTARRALNAIGMARQLALLIMDLRAKETTYDLFDDIVIGCDRIFYAQVGNGQAHRIPKGMGERVESAMGVQRGQISDYRSLLCLTGMDGDNEVNDIIWLRADEENWGLDPLIQIGKLPLDTLRRIVVDNPDFTFNDLMEVVRYVRSPNISESQNPVGDGAKATPPPKNALIPGAIIRRNMGDYWLIEEAHYSGAAYLCRSPQGTQLQIAYNQIEAIDNTKRELFAAVTNPTPDPSPKGRGEEDTDNGRKNWSGTPAAQWLNKTAWIGKEQVFVKAIVKAETVTCRMPDGRLQDFHTSILFATPPDEKPTSSDDLSVGQRVCIAYKRNVKGVISSIRSGILKKYEMSFDGGGKQWYDRIDLVPIAAEVPATGEVSNQWLPFGAPKTTATPDDYVNQGDDEFDDNDVFEGDSNHAGGVPDFEAFDAVNLELLQAIADAADILDLPESSIIEDLLKLDRRKIQNTVNEAGIEGMERYAVQYKDAAANALEQMMQRIEAHIANVMTVAREMVKES